MQSRNHNCRTATTDNSRLLRLQFTHVYVIMLTLTGHIIVHKDHVVYSWP
jgi:hypothetical protein